jgi:hypothetical protein
LGVAAAWAEARLFAGVVALACLAVEVRRGVDGSAGWRSSWFAGDMVLEGKKRRDPVSDLYSSNWVIYAHVT